MRSLALLALLIPATADDPERLTTLTDPEITESSGLVVDGDRIVTVNDSGDSGRVFTVDTATGDTVVVTRWEPEPTDVEALAPAGPGQVWVADIGDNRSERESVSVLRVPVGESRTVAPETVELTYSDGPRDAESLLAHPRTGRLHVVSKGILGGTLYAAPRQLDPGSVNRLEPRGPVLGLATGAAFFPDGRHLVVRNYGRAVVYTFPALEEVGAVPLPPQEQGEGIAVDDQDRLVISSEGSEQPVWQVELPVEVQRAMRADAEPTAEPTTPTPTPDRSAPEQREPDDPGPATQPWWPWLFGWLVGLAIVAVLLRSLRPR